MSSAVSAITNGRRIGDPVSTAAVGRVAASGTSPSPRRIDCVEFGPARWETGGTQSRSPDRLLSAPCRVDTLTTARGLSLVPVKDTYDHEGDS